MFSFTKFQKFKKGENILGPLGTNLLPRLFYHYFYIEWKGTNPGFDKTFI